MNSASALPSKVGFYGKVGASHPSVNPCGLTAPLKGSTIAVEYYGDKEKNPPAKEDVVRELTVFLETVEAHYGTKPMIYTGADIYNKYLKDLSGGYKMWISSLYTPLSWSYHGDWYIWQYLNRGSLEGYSGGEKYIDLNVLNNDKDINDLIVK